MLRVSRVLVDTNVWIEEALRHEPYSDEALEMFKACNEHEVEMLYSPTSLKDVFYIIPRQMKREAIQEGLQDLPSFKPAAFAVVQRIMDLATSAPVSKPECDLAWMLRNQHDDIEDNLIIAAAETCEADYVVTYDKRLIEHYAPACITPTQLTRLLKMR